MSDSLTRAKLVDTLGQELGLSRDGSARLLEDVMDPLPKLFQDTPGLPESSELAAAGSRPSRPIRWGCTAHR